MACIMPYFLPRVRLHFQTTYFKLREFKLSIIFIVVHFCVAWFHFVAENVKISNTNVQIVVLSWVSSNASDTIIRGLLFSAWSFVLLCLFTLLWTKVSSAYHAFWQSKILSTNAYHNKYYTKVFSVYLHRINYWQSWKY